LTNTVEEITSSLHELSVDQAFVVDSYQFDVEHEMYTLSLSLKCMEDFPQEEWDHLRYNMFLKPDILFGWLPGAFLFRFKKNPKVNNTKVIFAYGSVCFYLT
jgi:hypothetical protein